MNRKKKQPVVALIMGSDSDLPVMIDTVNTLNDFDVPHEIKILSAHRSPRPTHQYAQTASKRGVKVIIAAAGGAAHLAGVFASLSPLPVIGVPIKTSILNGIDSLYSIVQMPSGVPVATVGINAAKNAAILAIEILAVYDIALQNKLHEYKTKLEKSVTEKSDKLSKIGPGKYLELLKKST